MKTPQTKRDVTDEYIIQSQTKDRILRITYFSMTERRVRNITGRKVNRIFHGLHRGKTLSRGKENQFFRISHWCKFVWRGARRYFIVTHARARARACRVRVHTLYSRLLSSPFRALVIGRFHRRSRRVSVARSAVRCDVVQGQGHMVTGGRSGHVVQIYIDYQSCDPLPPSRPSSSSLPLAATTTSHRRHFYTRLNANDITTVCVRDHAHVGLTLRRGLVDFQGRATRQRNKGRDTSSRSFSRR